MCLCDVPQAEATAMPACGHAFCNDCWRGHLGVKVREGQSRRVLCGAFGCGAAADEATVLRLLGPGSELAQRYTHALLCSYVEDNGRVRWCPSVPHCGCAVELEEDCGCCEPVCRCGCRFCFSCGVAGGHAPATCAQAAAWTSKCADESETRNWIAAHTKPCPKCAKLVEKNGGCNLVQCTCGACFCWLCGQGTGREHTWTSISGHSCGRFKDEAEASAGAAAADLKRYLHYHSRWKAHNESGALEGRAAEESGARWEAAAEAGGDAAAASDLAFLAAAHAQLATARRVLANCYVFAYFFFGPSGTLAQQGRMCEGEAQAASDLFDDTREALETTTEELSKRCAEPPGPGEEAAARAQVVNLASLADMRCANLHEAIEHDLLGALQEGKVEHVAPYRAHGAGAASRAAAAARARAERERADLAAWQREREAEAAEAAARLAAEAAAAAQRRVSLPRGSSAAAVAAGAAEEEEACSAGGAPSSRAAGKRRRRGRGGAAAAALQERGAAAAAGGGADEAYSHVLCPICSLSFPVGVSNEALNEHVDACLQAVGEQS